MNETVLDYTPTPYVKVEHPSWSKDAVIYQINMRQFTHEGTFLAAQTHLPRLKALGVDILWLMPIHEIGLKNRKGSLGSPYAVKDYYSVNPEFGTLADFSAFLAQAHAQGFKIILDWVPNHTAWDSVLVQEHPEWYIRDWEGDFRPTPWCDWDDIIDLDYSQKAVRDYMAQVMKYWVKDIGIDGFRCDVAGFVPTGFWNVLRKELDAIKPVFMLAEWEARDLHEYAFDMTYGWSWYDTLTSIAQGKGNVGHLLSHYMSHAKAFPVDSMRMLFVSNHDKNAWDGTEYEQFKDALNAVIVLSVTAEGMPLIYNGQEAGNHKRLAFFEKDPIVWQPHFYTDFYRALISLKKANTALWNAHWGAPMVQVKNTAPQQVFSFVRENGQNKIFVVLNFSDSTQDVMFTQGPYSGRYEEYFSKAYTVFDVQPVVSLDPWGYKVYVGV